MSWVELAECRGMDPELFFPERGHDASAAKAVCFACPVRTDCLAHAIQNNETVGIWGGLSAHQRRRAKSGKPTRGPLTHGTRRGYYRHRVAGEEPCDACRRACAEYSRRRRTRQVPA
jgi:WhiB family redox-sensing transcriptional regulator